MELAANSREAFALESGFTPEILELAAVIAGPDPVADGAVDDPLAAAVRAVAHGDKPARRVAVDVLVEAGSRVDADDIPILGMLVHGTRPADIASVLGLGTRELGSRRQRMLHALLDRQ